MYLKQAFELVKMTAGQTGRNPAVGCIIVKNGVIIGIGAHLKEGTAHAEVQAIKMAGDATDATLYCTLEPCNHTGKTPPCTEAIIQAGITKVVFAVRDTSLDDTGIRYMESHGIEVIHAPDSAISAFYEAFFTSKEEKRPYVTLKLASTLDGKLADDFDNSKWLTNTASRQDVHRLRHSQDAVLVGRKTYEVDEPKLDARDVSEKVPAKVIISQSGDVTIHEADKTRGQRIIVISPIEVQHAETLITQDFRPAHLLELLYQAGISRLMLEGGSGVISEFIEQDCFDEVVIYYAPKLLGGTLNNRFYHTEESRMTQLRLMDIQQFEDDVRLTYRKGQ
ncbi:bifunctional diaminohydroxyphosphoribosylaminopyrimidine deaminase/5-amino-6-(5-phosphoribosylamino)uracil reductase RibD [Macrococcus brunensis]|uniref:bifunctional diaminohydroxyphosphoribosylaminopyrimidine deaminase/5-amino-6-(5-phosphoribosylamino)uracil reductase RibD n=1 Tax=Macrococcus brunensis TaxID=198483 RepID=UPI001EF093E9|nr:bifunctional diaminohydroxyphosphoribosylaminopyrimidine deaminase/5-amino-6-(5-phosphoribosylamino)uracil reductase RibD [Macrococcus brunensis]ULG71377.1 bifunctional diaminohydroxyphosphoribosylaminopyrimidine deaminase/5-amino-6-(5-phosphoribosylamino)uracil reductase RibD [Macrococcus brunensis]